jgi:hypothetical protein
MISYENQLTTSSREWDEYGWFRRLSSLIDQDTFKCHAIQDIATGTNARAANNLSILEIFHLFLECQG